MKKVFLFIFIFTAFIPDVFSRQVLDGIVALVNDKAITQSELNEAMRGAPQGWDKKRVLNYLINKMILGEEAKKAQVQVTQEEVENLIKGRLYEVQKTMDDFQNELKRQGISFADYMQQLKVELQKNRFVEQTIYPRIKVTEYDLEEFYKKHLQDYKGFEKIRFFEIFLEPKANLQGADLKKKADQIVNQLRGGASFSQLASQYSSGSFASKGGDSGLIETKTMRPDLLNVLLSLQQGKISNPLPLPNGGYFILKVVEKKGPQPRPFIEVKELVRQQYFQSHISDEIEKYAMEVRAGYFIEIR